MLQTGIDPATGFGLIVVTDILEGDERRDCLDSIKYLTGQTRPRFGAGRVLLDASEAAVQTREIATVLDLSLLLEDAGDRIAVIVASVLLLVQARRVMSETRVSFFSTRRDAIEWLSSPTPTGAAL